MESKPLHIILADDDESDRTNFMDALEESRIKTIVYAVKDGVELMDHLALEETPVPHLLFLDLNMPRKNGLACLKEIRQTEKLKDVRMPDPWILFGDPTTRLKNMRMRGSKIEVGQSDIRKYI